MPESDAGECAAKTESALPVPVCPSSKATLFDVFVFVLFYSKATLFDVFLFVLFYSKVTLFNVFVLFYSKMTLFDVFVLFCSKVTLFDEARLCVLQQGHLALHAP